MEVLENSDNPVVSTEKELQARRLAHVLEVRYLDDSLIPPDPDETLALTDATGVDLTSTPWYQPGTEPVFSAPNNSMDRGFGGGGGGTGNAYSSLVASLPLSLQRLDPSILEQIVQDQSLLLSLLNSDGSVNDHRVAVLQAQLTSSSSSSSFSGGGGRGGNSSSVQQFGGQRAGASSNNFSVQQTGGSVFDSFAVSGRYDSAAGSSGGFYTENINNNNSSGGGMRGSSGNVPRSTRWGGSGGSELSQDHMQVGGGDEDRYYDSDSFSGQQQTGGSRFNFSTRNQNAPWSGNNSNNGNSGFQRDDINKPPPVIARDNRSGKQFTGTKASTPCRFFNTNKGCQFGDKCQFGHFSGGGAPPPVILDRTMDGDDDDDFHSGPSRASANNTRWGPGGGSMSGPGGGGGGGGFRRPVGGDNAGQFAGGMSKRLRR